MRLFTIFPCLIFIAGATKREVICETEESTLTCPENLVLDVIDANYGFYKNSKCAGILELIGLAILPHCTISQKYDIKLKCDEKPSCYIIADHDVAGTEICGHLTKILEIEYDCVAPDAVAPAVPIVLGVVGGVVILLACICFVYKIWKRSNSQSDDSHELVQYGEEYDGVRAGGALAPPNV